MPPRRKAIAQKTDESNNKPRRWPRPKAGLRLPGSTPTSSPLASVSRLQPKTTPTTSQEEPKPDSIHFDRSAFQMLVLTIVRSLWPDRGIRFDRDAISGLQEATEERVTTALQG